jgi:hypothetical protein
VPKHPLAKLGLGVMNPSAPAAPPGVSAAPSFDAALGQVVGLAIVGDAAGAARVLDQALAVAPPGNAGWLLPVEPLLNVTAAPDVWIPALARLRTRAA